MLAEPPGGLLCSRARACVKPPDRVLEVRVRAPSSLVPANPENVLGNDLSAPVRHVRGQLTRGALTVPQHAMLLNRTTDAALCGGTTAPARDTVGRGGGGAVPRGSVALAGVLGEDGVERA